MRLLVVEDDLQLAARLSERLRGAGMAVDVARSRREAEHWHDLQHVAAIILDLGLPDGSGIDLVRRWRQRQVDCPVLILTARGSWQEKVEGLNAGADDFVVKPVRFEELLARLHALLRRPAGQRQPVLEHDGVTLDPATRCVKCDGQPVDLSRQEYRLLEVFLRRPGQVMSQNEIVEQLYSQDDTRELNAVEVLISRLRRKIGSRRITTLRGLGYRFGANP